jgi:hypothetical protein
VALPGSDELPSSLVHWWFFCWRYQQTIINLISLQTSDLSLALSVLVISMVYEPQCQIGLNTTFEPSVTTIFWMIFLIHWTWLFEIDQERSIPGTVDEMHNSTRSY